MDLIKMISQLRAERMQIDTSILVLERLAAGHGKRRGRPPKWMSALKVVDGDTTGPGKRNASGAAVRKRTATSQRKRSANRRAEAKKAKS